MILYYESSNGSTWDLKVKPLRARTFNAHDFEWTPQATARQYGEQVYRFDRQPQKYSARLSVFGTNEERRRRLNRLHEAFDADIFGMTPGKIHHGIYHIDCYITYSSTFADGQYTENEIEIYCPYPFWVHENAMKFGIVEENQNPFLDYPYDFAYDFMPPLDGYASVENTGMGGADYKLVMHGPAVNPYIVIGGRQIGILGVLGTSERVEIESRAKTVQKISARGTVTNMFNDRIKGDVSVFERIKSGTQHITWNGKFTFDLTIYEERSEPVWI